MHYRNSRLFFFVYVLFITQRAVGLVCYSCTSQLLSSVDEKAQKAMRIFLDASYHLPPVAELCDRPEDVEFKTISVVQCRFDDKCVKIESKQDDIKFVVRGCASQIYRNDVSANRNLLCTAGTSPSLCYCTTNMCNGASKSSQIFFNFFPIFFAIFTFKSKLKFF